jgi:hypothetical protein
MGGALMILQFGKFKGYDLQEVPNDYLSWIIETQKKTLSEYEAEQTRRQSLQEARLSWAERIVQAGYRTLAMQCHPDHGGSNESMRQVIAAQERLKDLLKGSGMT